jgi:two-component system sensor histidine kinase AlgZ
VDGRPSIARRLLGELAAYLLLAGVLTGIFAAIYGLRTLADLAAMFAFNLLVALSIGLLIDATHRLADAKLALDQRSVAVRLIARGTLVALAVFLGVEIARWIGGFVVPEIVQAFPREGVIRVAIPVSIAMVVIARERERMRRRAVEAELGAQRLEQQALKAELTALQSRTNPHFLFNALNTIAALIAEDPPRAERAVERLAELLRYALEGTKRPWVALREEIAAVESYLELERMRYGERLCASVDAEASALDVEVPPMCLQPLVENAVLHGVASQRGPTKVELVARRAGGQLDIVIDDDGPGPAGSRHRGTGSAHVDLRARLALLYGERARLELGTSASGGYRVRLSLPEDVG